MNSLRNHALARALEIRPQTISELARGLARIELYGGHRETKFTVDAHVRMLEREAELPAPGTRLPSSQKP